jgi:hypothetical protein
MPNTKVTGIGDNFYIGGYDLSGDVASVDTISGGPTLLETTTLKQGGHSRLGGVRDGSMSFTSFFEVTPTISTPGVPASTTPVTNNTGFPVRVTITGGTISNVFVNSVSVGVVAGTYGVPIGGTISITYTVAPTWNWFALGSIQNALANMPSADLVAMYLQGNALGNPSACMVSKETNYAPTRDNTGNLTVKVDVTANGFGVEWGIQVTAGLRTDNAATTSAFYDLGSGTAFGCQGYMQLVELVGTNVDVTVTHATTSGGSYTTLLDFGSQTAIGGFRQATTNITTVNEFIKVATTGTFTQAIFSVVFVQNKTAGVQF